MAENEMAALVAERAAAELAIRALLKQHDAAAADYRHALGAVGRGVGDERELAALDGALDALAAAVEQKRAALTAIAVEIAALEANASSAAELATRELLGELLAAYDGRAAELVRNPLRVDLWRELRALAVEGNRITARQTGGTVRPFFVPNEADLARWFQVWGREIGACLATERREPKLRTVSELLNMPRLHAAVARLLEKET